MMINVCRLLLTEITARLRCCLSDLLEIFHDSGKKITSKHEKVLYLSSRLSKRMPFKLVYEIIIFFPGALVTGH